MNGQCGCGYRPGRISPIDCRCVTHRELNDRLRKIDPNEGYYQKEIDELKATKQDKLIAGQNITIEGSLISADLDSTNFYNKTETDELLAEKQNALTAGENITISENVISSDAHMLVTLTPTGAPVGGVTDYTWTSEHAYSELVASLDKVAFKTSESGSENILVPTELYEALESGQNVIFGMIPLNDATVPKITNIELIVRPDGTAKTTETSSLLQQSLFFDTVASLSDATDVKIGDSCMTYGYLRLGDGVYNRYKIREITNADVVDGYNIVSITSTDNLVAERLQYGDELVIELEPSDNIQSYLDIVGKKTIKMPKATTVTVQDVLRVNSDTEIDLNGSTIFFDYARPATFPLVNWDETLGFVGFGPSDTFTEYNGNKNITIRNGIIKGGCSCFMHNTNVLIEDVEFTTLMSRHAMQFASCYGVTVRRCTFNGTRHDAGAEHSAECINIDPCNYGGQPWLAQDNVMYDHSPNKFVVIENNTFNKATASGQLYACAIGSHGADETGALICENFVATNNSLGEPYADAINVCDYDQVTISNNTVEFSTTTHDTYTFFVHCRGGLKNMTITDNLVENVGQFIYSDANTRERKNLLIEGNTINAIDLQGYAVMHIFHYENVNIQHNTIKCKYRAVHIGSLGSDPILYSVNANFKYNEVTTNLGGDVFLRFSNVHGCQIIGNTINYLGANNMAWEWTLALQGDTTDAIVMHNRTSDPKHFVNVNSVTDKFMYNNAQYTLSSTSGTTQNGTLASPLTNFTKLVLQLGDTGSTQAITLLPWLPHNRNKFYWGTDTSRTYKLPVVNSSGTVSGATLTINNDNTYSYTGNISLRSIFAYD